MLYFFSENFAITDDTKVLLSEAQDGMHAYVSLIVTPSGLPAIFL